MQRPKATVLYHYFYPDDVVSARHYEDFCLGLVERGWDVEVMPCNRGCRDERQKYPRREQWSGILIRRVWRPRFRQSSASGRLLNAAWMILAWSLSLVFRRRRNLPDVLVVGTDPILSVVTAWIVKCFRPSIQVAHWCFDLYPEAAEAEGMLRVNGWLARTVKRMTGRGYRSCSLLADLGGCMGERLSRYRSGARHVTLTPWALTEPALVVEPDAATRGELFGEASLGLLYSGNFGRAHTCDEFLALARTLRGESIHFCFGVRGNQADKLRGSVGPAEGNVSFAGFAPEGLLEKRLGAADIHLVSLRSEWTGVVVPSKFFGSLAAGRPVVFAGSSDSAVARWIREYGVGWVLDQESISGVADELRRLLANPTELHSLRRHCHEVYQQHFARGHVMDMWDKELRAMCGLSSSVKRQSNFPIRQAV